ncbi:Lysophospholipase L1 [Shimia gijangensis]|uniref:Lysophospholipase L1 n=1 Tax=Shimia gijangensis TaxID=1470563 RepID=A0A1M6B4I4_9RHOB|nr:SGNH/GDSL hydrolase family protein [Shimia gijangensis]SHI43641.1 Lysophospholipase L1 [Shimia gijangensis]
MMALDQIARLLLAPVLLAQGLWVRRTAQQLPEPPGPRSGGKGDGLRLLILGDSSAAGVGARTQSKGLGGQLSKVMEQHGPLTWHLEAEIGATTKTSLRKLSELPDQTFDTALLVHGVNDTTRFTSSKMFQARQKKLMDHLRRRHGVRHVILSGLPPMHHFPLLPQPLRWVLGCHAVRLDRVLAGIAQSQEDVSHLALDLPYEPRFVAIDGFHPSEDAYAVWAGQIAKAIPG